MDNYQEKRAVVKAKLKASVNKKKEEVLKTSDVATAPTLAEKANALKKKASNQYTSYIASKLLPDLNK